MAGRKRKWNKGQVAREGWSEEGTFGQRLACSGGGESDSVLRTQAEGTEDVKGVEAGSGVVLGEEEHRT